MMKRLSLYVTPTHSSVTIENGASRQTSANTVATMIDALADDDHLVFVRFCRAVVGYVDGHHTDAEARAAAQRLDALVAK